MSNRKGFNMQITVLKTFLLILTNVGLSKALMESILNVNRLFPFYFFRLHHTTVMSQGSVMLWNSLSFLLC